MTTRIGFYPSTPATASLTPTTKTITCCLSDLTVHTSTDSPVYLVKAGDRIVEYGIYCRSAGGTATTQMAAYVTSSSGSTQGARVGTAQTITTTSTTAGWVSVACNIDINSLVGQYIKPASANDVLMRRYYKTGVSGDSKRCSTALPDPFGTTSNETCLIPQYMVIQSAVSLDDVNGDEVVRPGGTVTLTTTGMATATGATIDGKSLTGFSGSANSFTGTIPDRVNATTYPAYGTQSAIITDGVESPSKNVTLSPKTTESYTTISGVISTVGYLAYYAAQVGLTIVDTDTITFRTAADLGVERNTVNPDSGIETDYVGTQTVWLRKADSGIVYNIDVITGDSGAVVSVVSKLTRKISGNMISSNKFTANTL